MPTSGTAREKLKWIFEMYDEDRSGILNTLNLGKIIKNMKIQGLLDFPK